MYLNLDVASSSCEVDAILNQQDSEQTEVEFEPGLSQQLRGIGCLIKPNMSVEEVCYSISQISK